MDAYEESVEAWRRARYKKLTLPDGWLALVGKFPIDRGTSRISIPRAGKTPRELVTRFDGERVEVELGPGDVRQLTGSGIAIGTTKLELLLRGDEAYLRVKDEEAPSRTGFKGIPHYPVDSRWRKTARLEPFAEPRAIVLDYEGGASTEYRAAGIAVFEVHGEEQRLTVLHDDGPERLYVLFKDPTSRDTTYGAGRFLYAPLPVGDQVILDFNQAFNPPCALTPWASCPLVPRENWLSARIEAGEMRPDEEHGPGS